MAGDFVGSYAVSARQPDHQLLEGGELFVVRMFSFEIAFEDDLDTIGNTVRGVRVTGVVDVATFADPA